MKEKEVCGIYLTGNPLEDYKEHFDKFTFSTQKLDVYEEVTTGEEDDGTLTTTKVYTEITEGETVTMGGIITDSKNLSTRSGSTMSFLTVEDLYGQIEVIVFPKIYERVRDVIGSDDVLKITGKLQTKEGVVQIIADNIEKLEIKQQEQLDNQKEFLGLILPDDNKKTLDNILDICESYPGDVSVIVAINGKKYNANVSVRKCEGLLSELKNCLSSDQIIFFKKK